MFCISCACHLIGHSFLFYFIFILVYHIILLITREAGAIGGDNDIMPQRNKVGSVHIVNTFDSAPCIYTIQILA